MQEQLIPSSLSKSKIQVPLLVSRLRLLLDSIADKYDVQTFLTQLAGASIQFRGVQVVQVRGPFI